MKKTILLFFTIFICTITADAQSLKRANQLFENRSYSKALAIYEDLDDKTPAIHQKIADCYFFASNMQEAAKWYDLTIKELGTDDLISSSLAFNYAQALKSLGNTTESDKWLKVYYDKIGQPMPYASTEEFTSQLNESNRRPYKVHTISGNSEFSDFGVAHYNDKIVFASAQGGSQTYDWNNQSYLNLFEASIDENGDIVDIIPFAENLTTKMHESNAVFTKDGQTMYFTRNSFLDGKKQRDTNKITNLKIYKATLVDGEWAKVTELPFSSTSYSVEHPALSPDESKLYFASDMPGSTGSFDIYVVNILDNGYGEPKNLGSTINTSQREQFPYVSSDNTLYFASDGHFGFGGLDIFKSTISGDNYTTPINLNKPINSEADDFAMIIDSEKETGFISSNRKGGAGDDDIYRISRVRKYYVTGKVQDKNSLMLLPGTLVTLFDDDNNSIADTIVGQDALYKFEIFPNSIYNIRGTRKLYIPQNVEFNTDYEGNLDKDILLSLESYEDAEKDIVVENDKIQIKINPIYFDFDKWNIRPDAAEELDNVVAMMKKYPEMQIEIGAHTDARGSDNYNLQLSHKRADSVRAYLVEQGIDTNNVKSIGYGEMQPLNDCIKEGICTDEEYDINRRCEFVILN